LAILNTILWFVNECKVPEAWYTRSFHECTTLYFIKFIFESVMTTPAVGIFINVYFTSSIHNPSNSTVRERTLLKKL